MRGVVVDIELRTLVYDQKRMIPDGEISVVGAYDYFDNTYTTYEVEELEELFDRIQRAQCIIGYNSDGFDIPILAKYTSSPIQTIPSIDLLEDIRLAYGRRIKLDSVAYTTLNKQKLGAGADAPLLWSEGKIEELKEYCLKDIEITKELFEYISKNKMVQIKDMGIIQPIKIDITRWPTLQPIVQNNTLF